mgnify:CR=1 FL=1
MGKIKCPSHHWISLWNDQPMVFLVEVKDSPLPIFGIVMLKIFTHYLLKQPVDLCFNSLDNCT